MTRIILVALLIATFLLQNCNNMDSNYNCFGASSPVDLTLTNMENSDIVVSLFVQTETEIYSLIKTLLVKAKNKKTICLESEGDINNGLYVYTYDKTFKIKLSYPNDFELNIRDTINQIPEIPTLEYLIDPKW